VAVKEEKFKNILGDLVSNFTPFSSKDDSDSYFSVDFTFLDSSSDTLYYIEIDSDNKVKIDVGECVLLYLLYDSSNVKNWTEKLIVGRSIDKCCFLTVIAHENNKVEKVDKVMKWSKKSTISK